LTSLTGSVALIETRRLGVSRRMLATPTAVRTILAGEALGRLGVALIQGLLIMLGSALIFGVNWGDPVGAGALLLAFALVGSGAGMLMGSIFSTEQQAGAVGVLLGLGLAALGGSMLPLELFSGTMRAVAHATPHAWANEGFAKLVRQGGGIVDILPDLGVLIGYAAVLFVLGTWRLRRALT
jgi:ABC-2 type transport system permease protein